jgi:hypothetical protein
MRRPDRGAGVRPHPALLMSAVDVTDLLTRSSMWIGRWRSYRFCYGITRSLLG